MYLSKFAINPARRGSRLLLSSPHAMHAAVLAGFPPSDNAAEFSEGRVLWRLDRGERQTHDLFIASPTPPDLTHLVEQAGWPTRVAWDTRDYRSLLNRLAAGQAWAFRLTANPVHSVRVHEGKDTQPVGHVTARRQQEWFVKRAARLGFELPIVQGEPSVLVKDRRTVRFKREKATVTLTQATYDGVLRIVDAHAVRDALVKGVGRAKGYGCGLLTLAPLP